MTLDTIDALATTAVADTIPKAADAEYFLHEQYLGGHRRSRLMSAYYQLKPVLPRRLQLELRRRYARRQADRRFPAWPIETVLLDQRDLRLKARLLERGSSCIPLVAFWPDHHRFAFVLTHDVEGPAGVANIERVLEVERRHGFVSSWNFVAEWYDIPAGTFDRLRAAGCEVGLHGIKHDGKLFSSRAQFDANLPKIHRYLEAWDAVGFRSPATHRWAEWMHELGCLYDSSFPDTDPFEPLAGGCCSIFPFMFGDVVELPITLVQDHTLMEILRQDSIDLWCRKCDWLMDHHGLINLITHPDYLLASDRLDMYDRFLDFMAQQTGGWHALPREVAGWWRQREEWMAGIDGGSPVPGPDLPAMWARQSGDEIVFDL